VYNLLDTAVFRGPFAVAHIAGQADVITNRKTLVTKAKQFCTQDFHTAFLTVEIERKIMLSTSA